MAQSTLFEPIVLFVIVLFVTGLLVILVFMVALFAFGLLCCLMWWSSLSFDLSLNAQKGSAEASRNMLVAKRGLIDFFTITGSNFSLIGLVIALFSFVVAVISL